VFIGFFDYHCPPPFSSWKDNDNMIGVAHTDYPPGFLVTQVFFENIQRILLLFAILETIFRIGYSWRPTGYFNR
jgi:hypothetical protein